MARGTKVWFNGKIVPVEEARISLFTHALHYGTGAFEGIRAYKQKAGGGAIFRLEDHVDRLFESAKILDFTIPYTKAQMVQACVDACKANAFEECYIRPIVFLGDSQLGVYPGENPVFEVAVLVWEWGAYLGDRGVREGARLKISSYSRPQVNSVMTKGKITGQYVTGVLAKREAKQHGYDEALLLDKDGFLAEGSGENLFMIKDGIVKTTPLTSILNGITRRTIIDFLTHQGLTVKEERFTRDEIWCADEVFMSGTAAEITPIQSIDGRAIGEGKPGPISSKLVQDYAKIVRGDLRLEYMKNWWTPIK